MKNLISIVFLLSTHYISCQVLTWETFVDSIPTLSSPRPSDLNNDGILDIVIGGGTEGEVSNAGIMAFEAYPNPTTGVIYLSQPCEKIEVYSQEGKLIMRKLKSDFIDLSSLVNGLYYLSLRNKQGIQQVPIVRISN